MFIIYVIVVLVAILPFQQFWNTSSSSNQEQLQIERAGAAGKVSNGFFTRGKLYAAADFVYTDTTQFHRPAAGDAAPTGLIVVQQEYLPTFCKDVLPRIKEDVRIAITDDPINSTDSCTREPAVLPLVRNPKVLAIWVGDWLGSINPDPKIHQISIGIATRDEAVHSKLEQIMRKLRPCSARPIRALGTFKGSTHSGISLRSGRSNERIECHKVLNGKPFVEFWDQRKDIATTWEQHSDYAFELCPEGNSISTHRFWECVITGTIPIVCRNPCTPLYLESGPVLVLEKWSDLTLELMTQFHNENASKCIVDNPTGRFAYWYQKIMQI